MTAQTLGNIGLDVESAVMKRYSKGAQANEAALCCPIDYDTQLLKVIPQEIIERDYGCGDPSRFVRSGDRVLDLGSGAGKICYIASQIVGPQGRVIGVDLNTDMLALAHQYHQEVSEKIGYDNIRFRRGHIQDLALDLDLLDEYLRGAPVKCADDAMNMERFSHGLRQDKPMIPTESIDVVLSNCVLNLVPGSDKRQLFEEIFRVLAVGGRAAISDIVSDEPVPEALQSEPELWSGCISGAFEEQDFLQAFLNAGFYGVELAKRDDEPWQTVEGIEFRSVTVLAHKGKDGPCFEHNQAVIYRGPFSEIRDDDGHTYPRGVRVAVCEKTFRLLKRPPYQDCFYFVEPRSPVDSSKAGPFDCSRTAPRHPRETKGMSYVATTESASCCGPDGTC